MEKRMIQTEQHDPLLTEIRQELMPGFETLLAGKTDSNPSFTEKARARWQQQVSDQQE